MLFFIEHHERSPAARRRAWQLRAYAESKKMNSSARITPIGFGNRHAACARGPGTRVAAVLVAARGFCIERRECLARNCSK